jgi:hypothetical protein
MFIIKEPLMSEKGQDFSLGEGSVSKAGGHCPIAWAKGLDYWASWNSIFQRTNRSGKSSSRGALRRRSLSEQHLAKARTERRVEGH